MAPKGEFLVSEATERHSNLLLIVILVGAAVLHFVPQVREYLLTTWMVVGLGANWWWAFGLFVSAVGLGLVFLTPYVLVPLFFKMRPLADQSRMVVPQIKRPTSVCDASIHWPSPVRARWNNALSMASAKL